VGLLEVLCHDQDRRVIGVAAISVALPDLQGEGEGGVGDVEQVQHRTQQGPLPDPILHVHDVGHLAVPDYALLCVG
jgi:hypothetical protein